VCPGWRSRHRPRARSPPARTERKLPELGEKAPWGRAAGAPPGRCYAVRPMVGWDVVGGWRARAVVARALALTLSTAVLGGCDAGDRTDAVGSDGGEATGPATARFAL